MSVHEAWKRLNLTLDTRGAGLISFGEALKCELDHTQVLGFLLLWFFSESARVGLKSSQACMNGRGHRSDYSDIPRRR